MGLFNITQLIFYLQAFPSRSVDRFDFFLLKNVTIIMMLQRHISGVKDCFYVFGDCFSAILPLKIFVTAGHPRGLVHP